MRKKIAEIKIHYFRSVIFQQIPSCPRNAAVRLLRSAITFNVPIPGTRKRERKMRGTQMTHTHSSRAPQRTSGAGDLLKGLTRRARIIYEPRCVTVFTSVDGAILSGEGTK